MLTHMHPMLRILFKFINRRKPSHEATAKSTMILLLPTLHLMKLFKVSMKNREEGSPDFTIVTLLYPPSTHLRTSFRVNVLI